MAGRVQFQTITQLQCEYFITEYYLTKKMLKVLVFFVTMCVSVNCEKDFFLTDPNFNTNISSESVLNLSNAGIKYLKKSFVESSVITHVFLKNNDILKIEKGAFDDLMNLVYLDLSGNIFPFEELTGNLSIETLVLDAAIYKPDDSYRYYNDYEKVTTYRERKSSQSYVIFLNRTNYLPNLKKLYLRRNHITSLQTEDSLTFKDIMPSLTHLYLNENRLSSVSFMKNLPSSLNYLYLNSNRISQFESGFLKNLIMLTLDGNPIKNICGNFGYCQGMTLKSAVNLKILSISSMMLASIEADSFVDLGKLLYLDMSHNKIETFFNKTFDNLSSLMILKLDFNQLKSFPNISMIKNLEDFSISHNNISLLEGWPFFGLSNLRKLNLSYNEITEIKSEFFDNLSSLESLDLSGNKLKILPEYWILPLFSLQSLYLQKNSFSNISDLRLTEGGNLMFLNIGNNPLKLVSLSDLRALSEDAIIDMEGMGHQQLEMGSSSRCNTCQQYCSNVYN